MGKRLFWGMGVTFGVAALYPISILINLGADGVRWIQNDPAYSFFVLLILPVAVGVFTRTFNPQIVGKLPKQQRMALLGLLVIMEGFAVFLASQEAFRGPTVAPIMLKEPETALSLDRCLRDCIHGIRADNPQVCSQAGCPDGVSRLLVGAAETADGKALEIYGETAGASPFATYRDFFSRGSVTAYVASFFDVFSGVFVMLILWYIIVLVTSRRLRDPAMNDAVIVVYGLLLLWFPARLYSEWYIHFYSVSHFSAYFAFWFLLLVALVSIPLLVLLLKPGRPVLVFTTVNGIVLTLLGLLSHFSPDWMRAIARGLETMPFAYFVAFAFLIALVLGVMVFAMVPARSRRA